MKIGFFDSGLGGLTILREVVKELPEYDYEYYADTANLPYGEKSEEKILELTQVALTTLFDKNCSLVIVACNTASSETLRTLQDTFIREKYPDRKALGVIVPTMEKLAELRPSRAILLATSRTVASGKYGLELAKLSADIELVPLAMPELVPLIESRKDADAISIVKDVLLQERVGKGEVVILGCTHYTVLVTILRQQFPEVIFISQDEVIPKKISDYLVSHPEIETKLSKGHQRNIQLSEHREEYNQLAAEFLGGSYVAE